MGLREYNKNRNCPSIRQLLNSKRTHKIEEDIAKYKPGRYCVAHCDGWSVILDHNSKRECFLWNPVSGQKVNFPRIDTNFQSFSKCILSHPPTNRKCRISFFCDNVAYVVFCQIGDSEWTKHQYIMQHGMDNGAHQSCFASAIMFNGKQYVISELARLHELVFRGRAMTIEETHTTPLFSRANKQILVDSCGDLFLVRFISVSDLQVYKVNFFEKKWHKVNNLGDDHRAFFICSDYSVSFQAKDAGLKENSVYFVEDNDQNFFVYNLEDGSLSLSYNDPNSGFLHFSYNGRMPVLRFPDTLDVDDREFVEEKEAIDEEKDYEEAEESDGVDGQKFIWSKLPMDLQESIPKFLSIGRDYMNFRAVCRKWRSLAPRCHWSPDSTRSSSVTHPWLMFFPKSENSKFCNFYDPIGNFTYHMNCSEAVSNSVIRYSKDGWLLLSQGIRSMFFYEPLEKVRVELPNLPEDSLLDGVCFSGSPTSSNFIVCGISHTCKKWVRIFYFDPLLEIWSLFDIGNPKSFFPSRNNPAFLNGYFYFMGQDGQLGGFRLTREGYTWQILNKPQPLCFPSTVCRNFLILFKEEFLSVHVGDLGKWVKVFKLDHLGSDWKEMESLGNLMFLVSRTTSLAVTPKEEKMKNKIFFPIFSSNGGESVFYSLDSCKWQTFGCENGKCDLYDTKELVNCTWIEPRLVSTFC